MTDQPLQDSPSSNIGPDVVHRLDCECDTCNEAAHNLPCLGCDCCATGDCEQQFCMDCPCAAGGSPQVENEHERPVDE